MNKLSIAILGPGAVGGTLAALFWKRGFDVTVIAQEQTAKRILREGIPFQSRSFGNGIARPRAAAGLEVPTDVLFIAVKSTALADALGRIDSARLGGAVVIPVLNGIEHMNIIRNILGRRVIAGAIRTESFRDDAGRVVHASPFLKLSMSSDGQVSIGELTDLGLTLSDDHLETSILSSEAEVLWGKLARLSALSLTLAAAGRPLGGVLADGILKSRLTTALAEGIGVAKHESVVLDHSGELAAIESLPPSFKSSLQRDVERRHSGELDAIGGAVVRAGKKYGVECPTMEGLIAEIEGKLV